jgi:Ca2+:H+ antiporter
MLRWLLVFVPFAIALKFLKPGADAWIFAVSAIAIIPLAGMLGEATEHLARRTSQGIGGLLNATFGNAAELIIAIAAIRQGLYPIVKASLTGSIIGNLLLVLGASILAGGLRQKTLKYNVTGARSAATMMLLAAIALIVPAGYGYIAGPQAQGREHTLSLSISVLLLITYATHLLFSLRTHKQLIGGQSEAVESEPAWSLMRSITTLAVVTAVLGWMSEILVGSVEPAAHAFGMTRIFVGVIVVAIIGNAAEHSTAVMMALKDRMELTLAIAIGSSIQVALLVAPVLVIASRMIGPQPMDLVFSPAEVLAVFVAVLITAQIAGDGESNWLEGVQLIAVYLILAMAFYMLPEPAGASVP